MSPEDFPGDGLASYLAALAALRQRLVVSGNVLPRADEPIDLLILAADSSPIAPPNANVPASGEFPA